MIILLSPAVLIRKPTFTEIVGSSSSTGIINTGIVRVVLYVPSETQSANESLVLSLPSCWYTIEVDFFICVRGKLCTGVPCLLSVIIP